MSPCDPTRSAPTRVGPTRVGPTRVGPTRVDPTRTGPACDEPPDARLLLAVEQFNAGLWYDCHETLEELWLDEVRPVRDLYKGVLQIAVALFHERRSNRRGALRLLDSGLRLIAPFGPDCLGLDVADLRASAEAALAGLRAMERRGPAGTDEEEAGLPETLVPRLRLVSNQGRIA